MMQLSKLGNIAQSSRELFLKELEVKLCHSKLYQFYLFPSWSSYLLNANLLTYYLLVMHCNSAFFPRTAVHLPISVLDIIYMCIQILCKLLGEVELLNVCSMFYTSKSKLAYSY